MWRPKKRRPNAAKSARCRLDPRFSWKNSLNSRPLSMYYAGTWFCYNQLVVIIQPPHGWAKFCEVVSAFRGGEARGTQRTQPLSKPNVPGPLRGWSREGALVMRKSTSAQLLDWF